MTDTPFLLAMFICLGVSWPFSIAKTLRTRQTAGKSPFFLCAILLGYILGALHQALTLKKFGLALWLDAAIFMMVAADLALYITFSRRQRRARGAAR